MVDWYNANWPYRKKITISGQNISGSGTNKILANFPFLFNISSIADNDIKLHALKSGNDFIFTTSDGITRTHHEIENWMNGSGQVWVRAPTLIDDTTSTFYLYYGDGIDHTNDTGYKPSGVWDISSQAVYHMKSGSIVAYMKDSTVNQKNASYYRNPYGVVGKVGPTMQLTPASTVTPDYFDGGSTSWMDFPIVTVEAWVNSDAIATTDQRIAVGGSLNTNKWVFVWDTSATSITGPCMSWGATAAGTNKHVATNLTVTKWYYVVGVRYPADAKIYVDGKNDTGVAEDTWSVATNGKIGAKSATEYGFNGKIAEVRISNIERTAGWIKTNYSSQNTPSQFLFLGAEETLPLTGPTWSSFRTFVGSLTSWTLNSGQYAKTSGMEYSTAIPSSFRFTTLKNSSNVFYPYGTTASWRLLSGSSDFT